jgi:hypothetical protein
MATVGVGIPSGAHDQIFVFCLRIAVILLWGALSDERMGLYFTRTVASGHFQSNPSRAQVPQNSHHILLSHLRLPEQGGPGPGICVP